MKKMILSIVLFLGMTSFAMAGWNGFEWGMTMQQTIAALKAKSTSFSNVRKEISKTTGMKDQNVSDEYIIAGFVSPNGPTRAQFHFDRKKRLVKISYEVRPNDCNKAMSEFKNQYGKPVSDEYRAKTKELSLRYVKWHINDSELSVGELVTLSEKSCLVMVYKRSTQ